MNKIYKVIWSKTKNCYVVVSEYAKRNGKCSSSMNKKLIAAFLAAGTVLSVTGSAWAESVALPDGSASATGTDAIAIGASAKASGDNAIAIGASANAKAFLSTIVGTGSVINVGTGTYKYQGTASSIFGAYNEVKQTSNASFTYDGVANTIVGIGNTTQRANGALILGDGNNVNYAYGDISADETVTAALAAYTADPTAANYTALQKAIAKAAATSGGNIIAVGDGNTVSYAKGSAIIGAGNTVKGSSNYGISNVYVAGDTNIIDVGTADSSVIGDGNTVKYASNSSIVGSGNSLTGYNSTTPADDVFVGGNTNTVQYAKNSSVIGSGNAVKGYSGSYFSANTYVTGENNTVTNTTNITVIGTGNAVGRNSSTSSKNTIVIGDNNKIGASGATADNIVIGSNRTVAKTNKNIIIGGAASELETTTANSVALGYNALAKAQGSVALGSDSVADVSSGSLGYDPSTGKNRPSSEKSPVWKATLGAISVGARETTTTDGEGNTTTVAQKTRQITNVAAGTLDTDAVNVAQLKNNKVHYYSVKSTSTGEGSNFESDGATGSNSIAAGPGAKAIGASSLAIGDGATAYNYQTIAIGDSAVAGYEEGGTSGGNGNVGSVAIGDNAVATGKNAYAIGSYSEASGESSFAFGENVAAGKYATVWGGGSLQQGTNNVAGQNEEDRQATIALLESVDPAQVASDGERRQYGESVTVWGDDNKGYGTRSTVFGAGNIAYGIDSTAFGSLNETWGRGSVAWGLQNRSMYQNSTAFGLGTRAEGFQATAFGENTIANGQNAATAFGIATQASGYFASTAFGYGALASNTAATAWGMGNVTIEYDEDWNMIYTATDPVEASGIASTAFGYITKAKGSYSTAFGYMTTADGLAGTAFGALSTANGQAATAFGQSTKATAVRATAFGLRAEASGVTSTAFGQDTKATGALATAFGGSTVASGQGATAFGGGTVADGKYSTAFGVSSKAYGENSLAALGGTVGAAPASSGETTGEGGTTTGEATASAGKGAVAIGEGAEALKDYVYAIGQNASASEENTIAIGNSAVVSGKGSIAFGNGAAVTGENSIAIGTGHDISGDNSGAFGDPDVVSGDNSYAIGNNSTIEADDGFILGNSASVTVDGGVALGSTSVASTDKDVAGYDPVTGEASTLTTATWKSTAAAVSVGDADNDITRQITGVAAGAEDTDAVNVAQLKAAVVEVKPGDNVTITTAQDTTDGHTIYTVAAKDTTYAIDTTAGSGTAGDIVNTYTVTDSDGNTTGTVVDTNTVLDAGTNGLALDGGEIKLSVKDTAGNEVSGSVSLADIGAAINTTYELSGEKGETAADGSTTYTVKLTDNKGVEAGTAEITDTNTTYTIGAEAGEGSTITTYTVTDSYGGTTGTIVDTNTTYTIDTTKGDGMAGDIVNTYTVTDSDGNTTGTIVDTNTVLAAGTNGLTMDGGEIKLNVTDTAGNAVTGSVSLADIQAAIDTTYTLAGTKGETAADGSTIYTVTLTDNKGVEAGTAEITDTNTTYTIGTEAGKGSVINTYTVTDSNEDTVGTLVDTNTTYTIKAEAGTGSVVTTYTVTDSDDKEVGTLEDTNTKYELTGKKGETAENGSTEYTITLKDLEGNAAGETTVVDTNTTYTISAEAGEGSVINTYTVTDSDKKEVGKLVDTNTTYTMTKEAGTGKIVNKYKITDSDGTDIGEIEDTDTQYELSGKKGEKAADGSTEYTITLKDKEGNAAGETTVVDTNTQYELSGEKTENENGATYKITLKDLEGNEAGSTEVVDTRNTVAAGENITVKETANADGSTTYTISAMASSNVKVIDGENTTVTKGTDGDFTTYAVNVKADGKVAEGDTGIVTGDTVYNETRVKKDGNYIRKDYTAAENITELDKRIGATQVDITNLDNRTKKGLAGAAALAALHPMDFNPDDKMQFSAGVGNYRGQTAAALGMFYRPDESVMFSIGGTFGNGDNMVNAGITFGLDGNRNRITRSRTAMAHEIVELREQVAKLSAIVSQIAGPDVQMKDTIMFPDVPANHWAYEYVEDLQRRGALVGYPDGLFKGDRAMTRYEFAALLDRALRNGFKLSERAAKEFEPELGRIYVQRISGEDNDRRKVERVRVNNEDAATRDLYGSKITPKVPVKPAAAKAAK